MPYINVRLTDDGTSAEKKAEVIRRITDVMANVLGKDPNSTFVVIDEVPSDNWGFAGDSVTTRRKRREAAHGQ
ncbi:4-oxalocrotonate tautomerase [Burkholderia lata]|uniref:tautomerase family protein n=1 Tax=Burkholderia lata (strain ATCC 17760 / DSM 23089 / LMG 22485 / NCIMB 9086 / R18194 / 383) TaxID=482957 RepID=UPI001454B3A9|nr:4-oxalocrotonate tautomerase family protein [Burkholderia lata]VWC78126.1 4-oxalocrotonate tautomerase [Burkholderia lata]